MNKGVAAQEISPHTFIDMLKTNFLSNYLLVAMPQLNDFNFTQSVVYISEHDSKGALGIIINKPLRVTLGNVLEHLNIKFNVLDVGKHPILMGGPISQENGFIIYEKQSENERAQLSVSSSKETLESIANNKGPNNFLVALGYSGWEAGQLEKEISRNDWLIVPYDRVILFETPLKQRWQKAALLIGIDINQLSDQVGHA
ncbi:YqgE/AlgH family protein [Coxiella endosymbiont of Dermacentor marginatus]|uniref:YqgE/AlgH family protein n=1 Tax=Coxiella endosymbiont of Dermacentor marginatus TaxID=1656159 RepID=UPI0022220A68|nr:YqgE/AlgH family protein [Coxiella endosymbiont of Dermacentor marginatus]